MNGLKVTTSWDDGDVLDKRLADLLSRYGFKGTFYITKNYRLERLSEKELKELAQKHEIGAHTLTHPDLRNLSGEELKNEIAGSKQWLEEVIGSKLKMFCYPKGFYNEQTIRAVKDAGFAGARTTNLADFSLPNDQFQMHTSIQVYPFPFRKLDSNRYYFGRILQPFIQRAPDLVKAGIPLLSMYSWLSMAKAAFDTTQKKGGVFHIWGHSWEIEKYGMWDEFESLLKYISGKQSYTAVTNGDLIG